MRHARTMYTEASSPTCQQASGEPLGRSHAPRKQPEGPSACAENRWMHIDVLEGSFFKELVQFCVGFRAALATPRHSQGRASSPLRLRPLSSALILEHTCGNPHICFGHLREEFRKCETEKAPGCIEPRRRRLDTPGLTKARSRNPFSTQSTPSRTSPVRIVPGSF